MNIIITILLVVILLLLIRAALWLKGDSFLKEFKKYASFCFESVWKELKESSAAIGLTLAIVFYFSSLWFVQNIFGCEQWYGWLLALPYAGVLLMIWWGGLAVWYYFRQATSFSEDERGDHE